MQRHDATDFEESYVALFVLAERTATRVLGDRSKAEDVAAETLARTLASWSRVCSYAEPFVVRVATNLSLDEVRRRRPRLEALPEPGVPQDEVVTRLALVAALGKLSQRQRHVLVLRYVVGLDEKEIADVLHIGAGTVKTHTQRGLETLRRRFGVVPEEVRLGTDHA